MNSFHLSWAQEHIEEYKEILEKLDKYFFNKKLNEELKDKEITIKREKI